MALPPPPPPPPNPRINSWLISSNSLSDHLVVPDDSPSAAAALAADSVTTERSVVDNSAPMIEDMIGALEDGLDQSLLNGGSNKLNPFRMSEEEFSNLLGAGANGTENNLTDSIDDLLNSIRDDFNTFYTSPTIFYTLVCLYGAVILVGIIGNGVILWAILGKPVMRTARNYFIVSLAISDLLLCVMTMPLTLWEVLK